MGLDDKLLMTVDVACGSLHLFSLQFDTVMAAHGRPLVAAIGLKKVRKENPVVAYMGDGAAYAIGMAETMHAAIRNDNVIVIVINNAIYGMTGGQMAPTTLPGQKTTSSPHGKDPKHFGAPVKVEDCFSGFDIAYLARGILVGAAEINKSKKMIRKAFEKHMAGEGLCYIELLSPCPTNYNLTPLKAKEFVLTEMREYFPTGEFKGGDAK
ncbi:MAG: 2-oxoglutarate oxidoreductase [Clostridia bacterium]|nr:2-oxoglutarate oxidoreductase [Clostridia bacterium]